MPEKRLKTVTRTQGNNADLKDGSVRPSGVALDFTEVPVLIHAFRRMVRELEFDVCEMAFSTYLCAKEHGTPFTALPIFGVRNFHHGALVVNTGAGIGHPKDLEGRAVGVSRGYTVTTGVWARGILEEEYGVDPSTVSWVISDDEHVREYRPPANVSRLPAGKNLEEMVSSGELAAAVGLNFEHADVEPLIPDAEEAGFAALRSRSHYPINHLMVVKDDVLAEDPEIAAALFHAFAEAKNLYVKQLRAGTIAEPTAVDRRYRRVLDTTGADPLPYGIEPNLSVIEKLIDHTLRQRILRQRPDVTSLFAETTRDLQA
jgi:hypothetical protein